MTKNFQEKKQETNIENYQVKKKIWRESMEEIEMIICLKKKNKD